jgi:hypothetical protein
MTAMAVDRLLFGDNQCFGIGTFLPQRKFTQKFAISLNQFQGSRPVQSAAGRLMFL